MLTTHIFCLEHLIPKIFQPVTSVYTHFMKQIETLIRGSKSYQKYGTVIAYNQRYDISIKRVDYTVHRADVSQAVQVHEGIDSMFHLASMLLLQLRIFISIKEDRIL